MKSLIGNKAAEKDIRDWLSLNGYIGKTARFAEIELHAILRPGWLQVFRFELEVVTVGDQKVQLFGGMHSDERYGPPNIVVYKDMTARDDQLAAWSEGLITQRRHRR
jgi:hypothetical protein